MNATPTSWTALRAAIAQSGNTLLGFARLVGVMPYLLEQRARGIVAVLDAASEAAITTTLALLAAPPQVAFANILWSDGPLSGWHSGPQLFNAFPIPIPAIVRPSSLTIAGGSSTQFSYVQNNANAIWTIVHNLERFPIVTAFEAVDQSYEPMPATVTYLSMNELLVAFTTPIAGCAILSGVFDPAIAAGLAA